MNLTSHHVVRTEFIMHEFSQAAKPCISAAIPHRPFRPGRPPRPNAADLPIRRPNDLSAQTFSPRPKDLCSQTALSEWSATVWPFHVGKKQLYTAPGGSQGSHN